METHTHPSLTPGVPVGLLFFWVLFILFLVYSRFGFLFFFFFFCLVDNKS
jgi:hypothetical protein